VRGRFGSFLLLNNVDLLLRVPLLALLVEHAGIGALTGTVITVVAVFVFRFLVTDRLVYLARRSQPASSINLTVETR
jgi:dolichol-phosphate mannosyltransferase